MGFRRCQGFAVPVVLLVGAVILVSVVTAASVTALGSRINVADEKAAYQALLAAESGINTFLPRTSQVSYSSTIDEDELNGWLSSNGFTSYNLTDSVTVSLQVVDVNAAANSFTVQSTGSVSGGRALKVVLQDYSMDIFNGNLGISAPAALTSLPKVTLNGNAKINGLSSNAEDWEFSVGDTSVNTFAHEGGFDLLVSSGVIESVGTRGGYVDINSQRYRIETVDAESSSLSLTPVNSNSSVEINEGSEVTYIPYAVAQEVASTSADGTSTVKVTNADQFRLGDTVYIGSYIGKITGISDEFLEVEWNGAMPGSGAAILEGTTIRREVLGAISEKNIDPGNSKNSDIFPGYAENQPLPEAGDELFLSIFGITKQQMQQAAAEQGQLYSSWDSVADKAELSGITYIQSGSSKTIDFCGTGILVVEGDLKTQNSKCDQFRGLIYVMGDWQEQGDRELVGAVVVEGDIVSDICAGEVESASSGCISDINGKGDKITYDPLTLIEIGADVSYSTGVFAEVPSTWRQR